MGGNEPDSFDGKTSQETADAGSVFKKRPVYKYFLQKFGSVYDPKGSILGPLLFLIPGYS